MVFTMWGGLGVATHVGTAMISYTVINDNQAPWTTYTDVGLIFLFHPGIIHVFKVVWSPKNIVGNLNLMSVTLRDEVKTG